MEPEKKKNASGHIPQKRQQYVQSADSIDLLDLAMFILPRWWLILIVALIFGGALGAVNHYMVSPSYQATATMYVTNTSTTIQLSDLQMSSQLTGDYELIMRSRTVLKRVIKELALDKTPTELSNMLSISIPDNSHCMEISVTSPSPQQSVDIVNCFLKYGVNQIYKVVGKDEPSIIDEAELDAVKTVKNSDIKQALIGALVGAVLVVGICCMQYLLDTSVKGEEDVEKYAELTVLAVVPNFKIDKQMRRAAEKQAKLAKKSNGRN